MPRYVAFLRAVNVGGRTVADACGMTHGGGVTLYVGFLKSEPATATAKAVAALSNDVDVLSVHGSHLFWQCRRSFADSTVSGPRLERLLGTPATIRNVNTVRKLAART